jgi:hypothetical protein
MIFPNITCDASLETSRAAYSFMHAHVTALPLNCKCAEL